MSMRSNLLVMEENGGLEELDTDQTEVPKFGLQAVSPWQKQKRIGTAMGRSSSCACPCRRLHLHRLLLHLTD